MREGVAPSRRVARGSRGVICEKLPAILDAKSGLWLETGLRPSQKIAQGQVGGRWVWEVTLSYWVITGVQGCHPLETSEISYAKSDLELRTGLSPSQQILDTGSQ